MGELHSDHLYQTNTLRKNDQTQTDLTFHIYTYSALYSQKSEKRERKKVISSDNNVYQIH